MSDISIPNILREVHRLRKHIRELQSEIEGAPRIAKAHAARIQKQDEAHKKLLDEIKATKAHIANMELDIKSTNQLLAKYSKQHEAASKTKEYEATQHEITHSEGVLKSLEEGVMQQMAQLDVLNEKVPESEKKLSAAKSELRRFEKESVERLERLKAEIPLAEAELKKVEATLPTSIRPQLERLVKNYGADAFAPLDNKACQQCRNTLTLEQISQLQIGTFLTCKSCFRALYLPA